MRCARRRRPALTGDDLVEDLQVAAGQERAAVDHHVDLVGAGRDRVRGVGELDLQRRAAGRERGGDRGDVDAGAAQRLAWRSRPGRGRRRPRRPTGRSGRPGRAASPWRASARTLPGVSAPSSVVRSTIGSPGRSPSALAVVLIDRVPSAGGPRLGADLVDAGQAVQEAAQRGLVPGSRAPVPARSGTWWAPAASAVGVPGRGYVPAPVRPSGFPPGSRAGSVCGRCAASVVLVTRSSVSGGEERRRTCRPGCG